MFQICIYYRTHMQVMLFFLVLLIQSAVSSTQHWATAALLASRQGRTQLLGSSRERSQLRQQHSHAARGVSSTSTARQQQRQSTGRMNRITARADATAIDEALARADAAEIDEAFARANFAAFDALWSTAPHIPEDQLVVSSTAREQRGLRRGHQQRRPRRMNRATARAEAKAKAAEKRFELSLRNTKNPASDREHHVGISVDRTENCPVCRTQNLEMFTWTLNFFKYLFNHAQ